MRHTTCVAPRALDFNPVTTRRLAHFRDPLKCATRRVWILVPQITSRFAFVSAFVRIATRRLAHLRYAQPPHPLYVNDVSFIYPMQSQGNNIVSPRRSTHVTPAVHFTVVHTQYDICHFTHSSQLLYEVLTTGYRWAFATRRCTPCTPHIPEALWNRTSCCCHFMSDSIHVSLSHPSPIGHWLGTDWKRLTLDLCVPSTSLSLSNGTSQHQPPSSTSPASPSRPPFQCHSRGAARHHEHRAMLPFVVTVSRRLLTSALGILPLVWSKPVLFACSPYVLRWYRSYATGRNPSQVLRVYPSSERSLAVQLVVLDVLLHVARPIL